jgi:hypothetical protein
MAEKLLITIDNRGNNRVLHAIQRLLPNLERMNTPTGFRIMAKQEPNASSYLHFFEELRSFAVQVTDNLSGFAAGDPEDHRRSPDWARNNRTYLRMKPIDEVIGVPGAWPYLFATNRGKGGCLIGGHVG